MHNELCETTRCWKHQHGYCEYLVQTALKPFVNFRHSYYSADLQMNPRRSQKRIRPQLDSVGRFMNASCIGNLLTTYVHTRTYLVHSEKVSASRFAMPWSPFLSSSQHHHYQHHDWASLLDGKHVHSRSYQQAQDLQRLSQPCQAITTEQGGLKKSKICLKYENIDYSHMMS